MSESSELPDAELISRCLGKDAQAWEILIRRYQRLIASITAKFKLSREDAADVFQSVSIVLFKQLPVFNRESKLSSWFITVTVRECWKLRQKSARSTRLDDEPDWRTIAESADPDAATSEEQILRLERQHLVRTGIDKLSEQCQSLLRKLFYSEQISYAELGSELGMPVASIGPTRGRCLARLKLELEKMGYR
jgi:RNA polymerase sigma factor (sigma-70 family)